MENKLNGLVVGITGASGSPIALMLLEHLMLMNYTCRTALLFTQNGEKVFEHEVPDGKVKLSGFKTYSNDDMFVSFASGHSQYGAMILCPCSMGTLGRIAGGISTDVIGRTADVMLKERRPLILVVREAPYNAIHLENMLKLHKAGAVILPASPGFYHQPQTLEELYKPLIDRILHHAGVMSLSGSWNS